MTMENFKLVFGRTEAEAGISSFWQELPLEGTHNTQQSSARDIKYGYIYNFKRSLVNRLLQEIKYLAEKEP